MKFDTNNLPIQVFPEQFSLRFYLRDRHSARPTDIIYTFRWPGRRINVNRGMKVVPEQWNPKDQRADVSYRFPEINNVANRRINRTLDDDKALFELIVWNVCTNPDEFLNFETIINEHFMSKTKRKEKSEVKVDVFKIIKDAIINNSTISEHTQDNYIKKGLKALIAFSKYREAMGEGAIDSFGMLNMDMIDAFVEYLKSGKYVRDGGAPYAMGTLNSIIKYAVSAIKCTPTLYIRKSELQLISAPQLTDKTADNNEIALQDAEVMKLWRYSPASEEDRKILDMFLLECTTGQRVSDLPKIVDGMQDRDGTLYITIVQEKTSKKIEVPIIFSIAVDILSKYSDGLPNIDKDKINKNINRIAKCAGITGKETISRHYSGSDKPEVTAHDRSDLISSHTGRRTFVSLLSVRGWNYEEIAKYTGHTNIKTVQGYDKSTAIDRVGFKKLRLENKVLLLSESEKHPMLMDDLNPIRNEKGTERLTSVQQDRETAVGVLVRAAEQLGFDMRGHSGKLDLLALSEFMEERKRLILTRYGEARYNNIKAALQYGATEEERNLLGLFFMKANHGRRLHLLHVKEARAFWKKR